MEVSEFARRDLPRVAVPSEPIPLLDQVEVAVVGGGTSGVVAAVSAARQEVKVALLEMNGCLGGTVTVGGVSSYWCSVPSAYTDEIDARLSQLAEKVGYAEEYWTWDRLDRYGREGQWLREHLWSLELRAQALLEMSLESRVKVHLDCTAIGTLVQGNQVAGVVIAIPMG